MEIRRIEGIYLQHALETSQGLKAQNLSRELNLKVLSTVPNSLLEAFSEGGNLLRGYVIESYGKNLRILLNNNQEILAENISTLNIQEGDYLELVLENENPISLKVVLLQRRADIDQVLDMVINPSEGYLFNLEEDINSLIKNSGLFYERKLLSYLLGNVRLGEVLKDAKAQIIQNLLDLAEEVQKQLNLRSQANLSLDHIKHLFLSLMSKTEGLFEIKSLLKSLYLENLNSWEFTQFVRFIENSGNRKILDAMERGDRYALMQLLYTEIKNLLDTPAGKSVSLAFERLKVMAFSLKDVEIKHQLESFIKALDSGNLEDLRESHNKLVSLLEDRQKLLPLRERVEREGLEWLNRLNALLHIQRIMVNNGVLVLPFKWDGRKAGIILKPDKEEYRVFINLNYPDGFVSALLSRPKLKETNYIHLSFYTNSESFYRKIEEGKHLLESILKQEGLNIKEFKLSLINKVEDLKMVVKQSFYDAHLYLVV
ncbi:hypothetical protein [Thermocrinis sp.]